MSMVLMGVALHSLDEERLQERGERLEIPSRGTTVENFLLERVDSIVIRCTFPPDLPEHYFFPVD